MNQALRHARVVAIALIALSTVLASGTALAHRASCHSRHSCEPDTPGAYVCGDKGICDDCQDNAYCADGEVRDARSPGSEALDDKQAGAAPRERAPSRSNAFQGRVRGITDGDTIVVQDAERHRNIIRIAAIDSPEKGSEFLPGQSYSDRARRNLAELIAGKDVRLTWRTYDDYRRVVARVWIGDVDVGLAQVCAGYAWVYEHYLNDLSQAERQSYRDCEQRARAQRRGLWRDPQPTPPWEWRHSQRSAEGEREK
jgi:endonuclease YncB( thermonuclease family)